MEVSAQARFTGISARKARRVLNEVRGLPAQAAVDMLRLMPQSAASVVAATITSALYNASENFDLEQSAMYVKAIYADQAPMRRWRRFGGRGRFKPWKRRSSHITVILDELDDDAFNQGTTG